MTLPETAPPPPTTPRSVRPPRWVIGVAAGLGGMLLGVVGGAVLGIAAYRQVGLRHDYEVAVQFDRVLTEPQREAVRAATEAAAPGEVTARTRQQNFERFRAETKDEELLRNIRAEDFPESLTYETHGTEFDCDTIAAVRKTDGVAQVTVLVPAEGDDPSSYIICP